MRRAYLISFGPEDGMRSRIKRWADTSELVVFWRTDLPYCFYLTSESTAAELCQDLERAIGKRGRYLVTEISENREGKLPAETWYLLNHKDRMPEREAV